MLFRPYADADFEALYTLEELCFQPPLRFTRRYMRSLVARPDAAVWVAARESGLAGFAVAVNSRRRRGVRFAYIETIEVAPDARGLGLGRELLQRLEDSVRASGASFIWLHTDALNGAAIRLYESAGYQCQGREENFYPQGRAALVYRKGLAEDSPAAPAVARQARI
ncbi:MAG: N-acetyltransferase [Terracidiphilus sp.]